MRVVPSDVIGLIRQLFPANTFNLERRLTFSVSHRPHFVTILAVVMQIPTELLTFSTEDTAKQCRLAKGFRNLIHPGAEQRRSEKCGKPEALSAAAGAEHVVRDLSR